MVDDKERKPRIAVTGGSGFVGSHVVELLLERGHEVNCLVIPGEGAGWLSGSKARLFEGGVTDRPSLGPFLEGCAAIVNIAGLTRARTEAEFMAVNSGGAVNLAEAALAIPGGPRHIVSMSSLAAAGPCEGECGSGEDGELRPLTPYGRSKAALEASLRAYEGRLAATFIRAPGVYGPRDRDFLQYFRLVRRGIRAVVGRRSVMSVLYVKTLARAVADCVLDRRAYGQAFNVADEGEYDWDDLSSMMEEALGVRTRRVAVPDWAVAVAAVAAEAAKPFARRPPLLDRYKLLEMRQSRWVASTDKARRLLGFVPAISTRDAMAETASWYLANGWL